MTKKIATQKNDQLNDSKNLTLEQELKNQLKNIQNIEFNKTSSRGIGRKTEIINLFKDFGSILTMDFLSQKLDISKKNVSSQFSYLRKEGYDIRTQKIDNIFYVKIMNLNK